MKKSWMVIGSCVLATSLMAGSAFAESNASNANNANNGKSNNVEVNVDLKVDTKSGATVTSDTYGNQGHNGYKGLLNAINNVKDKPAGAVIAELLLTKYQTELTAEMKA